MMAEMEVKTDTIRVLIVDDEILAREGIRAMLKDREEFEVVGECSTGQGAAKAISDVHPDLLFLDVQMPCMNGLELLCALDPDETPTVIFVTAYDQYAVQAFDHHAVDYILKPYDRERFDKALKRAKEKITGIKNRHLTQQILNCLQDLRNQPIHQALDHIIIKSGSDSFFLKLKDVDYIEAEGNYVRFHVGKESYLVRESISKIEGQIDTKNFARIHRSAIVNLNRIQKLTPMFHSDYRVILHNGTELTMSRIYRKNFKGI